MLHINVANNFQVHAVQSMKFPENYISGFVNLLWIGKFQ